jgi:hypothetical protein
MRKASVVCSLTYILENLGNDVFGKFSLMSWIKLAKTLSILYGSMILSKIVMDARIV